MRIGKKSGIALASGFLCASAFWFYGSNSKSKPPSEKHTESRLNNLPGANVHEAFRQDSLALYEAEQTATNSLRGVELKEPAGAKP